MDGNRRWAAAHGLPSIAGHVQGVEAIKPIVRVAPDRGIEVLSLYVFSQENWRRSEEEVTGLLGLVDGRCAQTRTSRTTKVGGSGSSDRLQRFPTKFPLPSRIRRHGRRAG